MSEFHADANLSVALQRQLTYFETARFETYRPTQFRSILQIDNSVPTWADWIELSQIKSYGSLQLLGKHTTTTVAPTVERSDETVRVYEFGCHYEISRRDLQRAERAGVNISERMVQANQNAADQLLDEIACVGKTVSGITIPGLFTSTTGMGVATASTKALGGLTWAVATPMEIVADLETLMYQVEETSKQAYTCDRIILPIASYRLAATKRNTVAGERSALEIFRTANPGVAVSSWRFLSTAGAGSTNRAAGLASKAKEVARMVIPQELTDQPIVMNDDGWRVPQRLLTAGVLIEAPFGIAYMDGI